MVSGTKDRLIHYFLISCSGALAFGGMVSGVLAGAFLGFGFFFLRQTLSFRTNAQSFGL